MPASPSALLVLGNAQGAQTEKTIDTTIQAAASLIAEIDPALALAFVAQPFNRSAMVTVFHSALSKSAVFAPLADEIAMRLRCAIDSTRLI